MFRGYNDLISLNQNGHFLVKKILSNTGFNILGIVASSLMALIVTPLLLSYLGGALFGVWALFGIVITASHMLDFGLNRALVRNIAHYRALAQWSFINQDFNSALWPLAAALLVITIVGWGLAAEMATWLGVPPELQGAATPALQLLMLSLLPVGLGLLLGATLEGAQRMAYTSGAMTLNRLLFTIGVVMVVNWDWGLVGVSWSYLAAVWTQLAVLALAAIRVTPTLRLAPRLVQRMIFQRDLRFGLAIFATALVALVFTATNKIILARWVGLDGVATYEVASVIAIQLFTLAMAMSRALYPALVVAQTQQGLEALRGLFSRVLHLLVLFTVPVGAMIIALAIPFVNIWLGATAIEPARSLQWLVGAWSIAAIATAASVGLLAIGRPVWATVFSTYNALLNLLLALLLTPIWGYWGVIAANVIAVGSSALLTLWLFAWLIQMDRRSLIRTLSPKIWAWAIILAGGLAWFGARQTPHTLIEVGVWAGIYSLVYGMGLLGLKLLWPEERTWLHQLFE